MKNQQPDTQAVLNLDWGLFFTFEINTEQVTPYLLEGVHSLEVRPGISLLDVNVARYTAADIDMDIEGAWNIDASVRIIPVPIDELPDAETAACVMQVSSDRPAYLDVCVAAGYPVYQAESLSIEYSDTRLSAHVQDARGPIFSLNYSHSHPDFAHRSKVGQEIVSEHGDIIRVNFKFETTSAITKQSDPHAAVLYNHPFFLGMDVAMLGKCNCAQMALRPNSNAVLSYYARTDADDA